MEQSWVKSEMGVRLGQWLVARLEVPEPRLGAHADRDPRAEQGNLLLDIYHKSYRAPYHCNGTYSISEERRVGAITMIEQ